MNVKVRKSESE